MCDGFRTTAPMWALRQAPANGEGCNAATDLGLPLWMVCEQPSQCSGVVLGYIDANIIAVEHGLKVLCGCSLLMGRLIRRSQSPSPFSNRPEGRTHSGEHSTCRTALRAVTGHDPPIG
jgi:hypothetical protein